MKAYKVWFTIGRNTGLCLIMEWCFKHDTMEQFEADIETVARSLSGKYLYKEDA